MICRWDERKNRINRRKHGLSFEAAQLVFDDPFAVTAEDFLDANGEMRYQTIGLVEQKLLFVAHVYRMESPWIISARKVVKHEEQIYWAQRGEN